MRYTLQFKPRALKDLDGLSPETSRRVLRKLEVMRNGLAGDVRRLVHYLPGWRLRVGDWRVLFEIKGTVIEVWRVVHRSEAYE